MNTYNQLVTEEVILKFRQLEFLLSEMDNPTSKLSKLLEDATVYEKMSSGGQNEQANSEFSILALIERLTDIIEAQQIEIRSYTAELADLKMYLKHMIEHLDEKNRTAYDMYIDWGTKRPPI
jgi:hypothetical protein